MDTTPLDIELVRQSPSSDACVKACTQMVLNYYEYSYKKRDLKKRIHSYKKHSGLLGTYIQDVGLYLLTKGFKAEISHYDWRWWSEEQQEAYSQSKKQLIKSLEDLKNEKEWGKDRVVGKEIKFLERGGVIKFEMPALINIDVSLSKNIPPILLVQAEYFYHQPKDDCNHAILVIGKKNNEYIIRDPLYAVDKIVDQELFYSWARSGGWMLTFPPKEKRKAKQEQLIFT